MCSCFAFILHLLSVSLTPAILLILRLIQFNISYIQFIYLCFEMLSVKRPRGVISVSMVVGLLLDALYIAKIITVVHWTRMIQYLTENSSKSTY